MSAPLGCQSVEPSTVVPIRVVLVDDLPLLRAGLITLLRAAPRTNLVADLESMPDAPAAVRRLAPDVLLVTVHAPGNAAVDVVTAFVRAVAAVVRCPPPIVALSRHDVNEHACALFRAGVSGLLQLDATADQLLGAVHAAARGHMWIDPGAARYLVRELRTHPSPPRVDEVGITRREAEVWQQVALGRSNAEIAVLLCCSVATVKTHVSHAMAKLGARDRAQLVAMAYLRDDTD